MPALPTRVHRVGIPLLSFLLTAIIATVQHWSARDLAWTLWFASLSWSTVYLVVFGLSQDMGLGCFYTFMLFFFYFIFGGFIHGIFEMIYNQSHYDAPIYTCMVSSMLQGARYAVVQNWPFLLFSAIHVLPDYILDARTVHLTNLGRPLFARDGLKMYLLIFLLTIMYLLQWGAWAIYAILLIYFFPWHILKDAFARPKA